MLCDRLGEDEPFSPLPPGELEQSYQYPWEVAGVPGYFLDQLASSSMDVGRILPPGIAFACYLYLTTNLDRRTKGEKQEQLDLLQSIAQRGYQPARAIFWSV